MANWFSPVEGDPLLEQILINQEQQQGKHSQPNPLLEMMRERNKLNLKPNLSKKSKKQEEQ
jgi:hypothetical protein